MDYHKNARLTIHSREQLAKMVVERGSTLKAAAARGLRPGLAYRFQRVTNCRVTRKKHMGTAMSATVAD
jgi:hypothetical protein